MRKNKIVIRGAIEVDQKVLPERCCWTAGRFGKLFSILTVEVDYKMFPPIVSSKHYVSYHMVHTVWLVSYDVSGSIFSDLLYFKNWVSNFDFEALHSCWATKSYFYDIHYSVGNDLKGLIWENFVIK